MTNYFFKIVIWLHYWLLYLKSNQITNYFTSKFTLLFKLSYLKIHYKEKLIVLSLIEYWLKQYTSRPIICIPWFTPNINKTFFRFVL